MANVKTYGPWLPLTPDASPVDGLFDVFVMKGDTHRQVFAKLLRRHLRTPGAAPGTLLCRGERVSVSGLGSAREQLEILRHRLPVVVSPETAAALERGPAPAGGRGPPGCRPGGVTGRLSRRAPASPGRLRLSPLLRRSPAHAPMAPRTAEPDPDPYGLAASANEAEGQPIARRPSEGGEGGRIGALERAQAGGDEERREADSGPQRLDDAAVATVAPTCRLRRMTSTSIVPTSQLAKWNPTETRSARQCER